MDINDFLTILIAICPTVTAVISVVIGFLSLIKTIKTIRKDNDQAVVKSVQNIERMDKKLSILNTKIASIEQYLVEQKEKRK